MLCLDEDDLVQNYSEAKMPEPWEALKDEVLSALREEVKDFASELKDSAHSFIQDQAVVIAREKWRQLNASTPEEKELAASNLRHLQGQIGAEIARLQLAASVRGGELLERVLSTAIGVLVKIAPALLG